METIHIFTDGACSGNPGPGGWAAIMTCGEHRKTLSGGFRRTTNNRMELMAVKEALSHLKKPGSTVVVHSDSQIVVNPFNSGNAAKRVADGTQTNIDLWKEIIELSSRHSVTMEWVKGHSSDELNNECDELAVRESRSNPSEPDTAYEMSEAASVQTPPLQDVRPNYMRILEDAFGKHTAADIAAVLEAHGLTIIEKPF